MLTRTQFLIQYIFSANDCIRRSYQRDYGGEDWCYRIFDILWCFGNDLLGLFWTTHDIRRSDGVNFGIYGCTLQVYPSKRFALFGNI